jgi:serine/threonine protein kinase
VSFVDGGRIGPVAYLAVELLGSGTLKERLAGGRISPHGAQRLALELSDALAHAHDDGILHRDIKPANILFRDDGRAVLADFGMAKILEASQLTTEGTSVGTPLYMSPAQLAGAPPTVLDDIYGLGATIYHAVSGQPPQRGRTVDELRAFACNPHAVAASLLELVPDAPEPFAAAIQACVSKDPASRPATAHQLRGVLSP